MGFPGLIIPQSLLPLSFASASGTVGLLKNNHRHQQSYKIYFSFHNSLIGGSDSELRLCLYSLDFTVNDLQAAPDLFVYLHIPYFTNSMNPGWPLPVL